MTIINRSPASHERIHQGFRRRSRVRVAAVICALAMLATACSSTSESSTASVVDEAPTTTVEVQAEAEVPDETASSTTEPEPDPIEEAEQEELVEPVGLVWADGPVEARPISSDCAAIGEVPVGLQTGAITSGGLEYDYQWTVPTSYDGSPLPVVLDFHGLDSDGAQHDEFIQWSALAEEEGFLAVQPNGLPWPDFPRGWEIPQFDTDPGRNDVAMVLDLLDHIAANVCIDPDRIYSTGFSMGGFFTSTLVCQLSEVIAAAAAVGGINHHNACDPARAVPFIAFHGTDDMVNPFEMLGNDGDPGTLERDFWEQGMPDVLAEYAAHFGCADSEDSAVSESATLTSYTGCDDDVEVGFYTIDGGGHTWPGSIAFAERASFLGHTTMEIDANQIAWEFFQRNSLPG